MAKKGEKSVGYVKIALEDLVKQTEAKSLVFLGKYALKNALKLRKLK